jgi:tyrosine aminotransferase
MYAMVKIDIAALKDIDDDCIFSQKLLQEENLLCLPGIVLTISLYISISLIYLSYLSTYLSIGQCFGMPNFIRLVTCAPADKITDAFERISIFCQNHKI